MAEHRDWRGLVGDARLVAVLARPRHDDQVAELTAALPGAVIVRLDVRRPLRDLHVHLAAIGPVDALVDLAVAGASERREALGPHVRAPGQQTGVVPIIRDAEVARVLELDVGRGRVLETRPGASWTSAAVVRASGPMELNPLPATIEAPPLVLREWYDVVALPRQAVLSRDLLLPESFTTADGHRQRNPTVDKINAAFARPPRVPADLPRLEGAFLHLESVMPRHFGHALTEQVAHFWGWRPGLRALVFDPTGELPAWQADLLAAGGIDDVHVATGPVRVETLVGTTPMFSRPAYAHPDLLATYDLVGAALEEQASGDALPAKVFFTRRPGKRSCRNAAEVEAVFGAAGYAVVHPEDHPLADQVAMVRAAESVAGFAGSGMFHIGFAGTPTHVVLVASEAYPCHNEYLMSALVGHRLDIVLCRPDVPRVDGAFTRESFHSDYVYDPARDGDFLRSALQ